MSNKLELTWVGKNERTLLEPRILIPDDTKSVVAPKQVTGKDTFDNKLIFGDNLLALKALESEYAGKVKCVYIDPPYNTDASAICYKNGYKSSSWASLIHGRLENTRPIMTDDGVLVAAIDDMFALLLVLVLVLWMRLSALWCRCCCRSRSPSKFHRVALGILSSMVESGVVNVGCPFLR